MARKRWYRCSTSSSGVSWRSSASASLRARSRSFAAPRGSWWAPPGGSSTTRSTMPSSRRIRRGHPHARSRLVRLGAVLPQDRRAPLRRDDAVRPVFEHEDAVGHAERKRPPAPPFAEDRRDDRDPGARHRREAAADRLALAALLGANPRVSPLGVDEREDGEAEAVGELEEAARLPVPLGLRLAEVPVTFSFVVRPSGGRRRRRSRPFYLASRRRWRGRRRSAGVAVELLPVGEQELDVVECVRAARVSGELAPFARGLRSAKSSRATRGGLAPRGRRSSVEGSLLWPSLFASSRSSRTCEMRFMMGFSMQDVRGHLLPQA